MITFESEYKNFNQRLFSLKNLAFLIEFIFYSSLIIIFDLSKIYTILIELALLTICIFIIITRSKHNIDLITFEENNIILHGETYNKQWEKPLKVKETLIKIKGNASRQGLSNVTFYIILKNKKNKYIINSFDTFSDEGIIKIFKEFKKQKDEKIISDERFTISRIQEKIEKCQ